MRKVHGKEVEMKFMLLSHVCIQMQRYKRDLTKTLSESQRLNLSCIFSFHSLHFSIII